MSFEQILFYVFSAILVFAASMVISVRNPVHAILFLVLSFFTSAALWLLLEAEFLAIILVLVYVGAVMVLFLFVVMMLDLHSIPAREGVAGYLPIGLLVAVLVIAVMAMVVGQSYFGLEQMAAPERVAADHSNIRELGLQLYTTYAYPFEIAAVILLVAIVAAIPLTLRRRVETKSQNVPQQVAVRRNDRLKVLAMDAEQRK
ncbi:MAG: NADH-quinone oxidoreductase subunit J [Thiohalomonadaceae bacterium]